MVMKLEVFSLTFQKPLITSGTMITAWKMSKYGVFSGLYFPAFGLNTEKMGTECGKIRTRKNFVFGHFSHSRSYTQIKRKWDIVKLIKSFETFFDK